MSDGWSKEELRASVEAYLDMLDKERHNRAFVKKHCYAALAEQFGRSAKAFEYRMQNISYVMTLLGRDWVTGLKPAKNVGANVITDIQAILAELESEKVLREVPLQPYRVAPVGEAQPEAFLTEVQRYARMGTVRGNVLALAGGRCEACDKPAPFNGADDQPFLEVHHVRPLAQQGSDTVANAVALCPNCHRAAHHSKDALALIERLYQQLGRLVRE
jgi:5-methylcytosine-specific restriction enzyme A